jgi:hypothetical protein
MPRSPLVILPLPRPQYVPVPEALISSLAWRLFRVELSEGAGGRPIGLMYRPSSRASRSRTLDNRQTLPEGQALQKFADVLKNNHLRVEGEALDLALAVLNSVGGVRIEKSGSQPASPLTPGFALLQNMRGLQGTRNPPDLAEILETLFSLGLGTGEMSSGVAKTWLSATEHRMSVDPLLRVLDSAVDESVLGSPRQLRDEQASSRASAWKGALTDSPFSWFVETWLRLTSQEWVEALPARVWVDWASTILRLALGLGFLWESAWYESLARRIIGDGPLSWSDVREGMDAVVPWKSSRAGAVALDIAPQLSWRVFRGDQLRGLFTKWLTENSTGDDFQLALAAMRDDAEFSSKLVDALGSNVSTPAGKNLWEAIKYALKTRDSTGEFADYYGLLRTSGRYLTVEPGTEWIAVVASLASGKPGSTTDVGTVLLSLQRMGIRPELRDLIDLLEKAGIARGSADADQGVLVQSAF